MKLTLLPTWGKKKNHTRTSEGARPGPKRNVTRIVLLVILGVVSAVFLPQRLTGNLVTATKLDGETVRAEANALNERATDAGVVRSQRDDFDRRADEAMQQLPKTAELGNLITDVEEAVRGASMRWLSGTPTDTITTEGSPVTTWGLEISVQGPQSNVRQLITSIEGMPRYVSVAGLNVQRTEGSEVIVNLSLRFHALEGPQ